MCLARGCFHIAKEFVPCCICYFLCVCFSSRRLLCDPFFFSFDAMNEDLLHMHNVLLHTHVSNVAIILHIIKS